MKVARFEHEGRIHLGLVEDERVRHLDPDVAVTEVLELAALQREAELADRTAGHSAQLADIRLLPIMPRPGKMLGIGLNYRDHAAETGREPPKAQMWFNKQSTCNHPPFDDVVLPVVSTALDYEAELVVVIGRRGRHVPREHAHDIVAGYMCGCDYSVRDWQRATPTMIMGKGFDTHGPTGPWLTTRSEIPDVSKLRLRSLINGECRQDGCAADMIFDIPAQIEHLTKAFPLEPGDLIFTGTPAGVGVAHDPPAFLRAGDRVRVEIDQLGAIEATIVEEKPEAQIG